MFSSAQGGELFAVSPPVEIHVCLCGQPVVPPKRLSLTQDLREILGGSFEKALRFRESKELETIKRRLLGDFATRAELLSAIVHLETLTKVVEQAEKDKEPKIRSHRPLNSSRRPSG